MEKNKGGRPNKWDEIMDESKLTLVEGWKRDGLSDEQVAKNLGISYTLLKEWKKKYPTFLSAIKKGKEVSDYELENTLHKMATGYYYTEDSVGVGGVEEITKYAHPNPTSLIFALKNRLPHKYRDKREHEHSGTMTNNNIDMSDLTVEELRKLARLDEETGDSETSKE